MEISTIITIMVIIIAVCSLLFIKPKKKQPTVLDEYNEFIEKYNKLINELNFAIINKRNQIIIANDIQAMKLLNKYIEELNYYTESITNYCDRIVAALKDNDIPGANYCLINIREQYIAVQETLQKINGITVTKNNNTATKTNLNFDETTIKTVNFFENCTTEEEINSRYKALAKVFHPDAKSGDKTLFIQIQKEYETLLNGGK